MDGELSQGGRELRTGKKVGKMVETLVAGNSGRDFLKTGKWNTPVSMSPAALYFVL